MSRIKQPLSNVQLEILKAYSHNLDDRSLEEFKRVIAGFFSKRAIKSANEIWDEEDWNDDKVEGLLNSKLRKSR